MVEIIRQLLQGHEGNVRISKDDDITIYQGVYPEDCVQILEKEDKFMVLEVHRDRKFVLRETLDANKAAVYAAVLCKFFYDINLYVEIDRQNYVIIRNYIEAGEEDKALKFTTDSFPDSVFSIDYEDTNKISLIRNGDKAHVKYGGQYIVKDDDLITSYAVFNTYTRDLNYISDFYENRIKMIGCDISREDIFKLYIFKE